MFFRQVIHEDLGCASYLIGDMGSKAAVVVDPQWEIEPYLQLSRLHGLRIEHVLETHTHADHVSGHGRLVAATGAAIHVHELSGADYPHEPFADGWKLSLGDLEIEAMHTPGHRPEHTSFLLRDGDEPAPAAVLTGDSLLIGDVARPDLAVEPREGAADVYRSLHQKLLALNDDVEVWPGHLGGSLCGSSALDHKPSSTIGHEKASNSALQIPSEKEFIEDSVGGLGDQPPNVHHIVALNKSGPAKDAPPPAPLSPYAVEVAMSEGAMVVDARTNEQFDEAHIPGAISASAYDTGFATKVAHVAQPNTELVVVAASDGFELEAAKLLASVGLKVRGFLEGGMSAWRSEERPVGRVPLLDVQELARRLDAAEPPLVLDVRDADEFQSGHIPGSIHIPYGELPERTEEVPRDREIATVCSGGKRSGLGASILKRAGFERVLHVSSGGVGTWEREGHPVERG